MATKKKTKRKQPEPKRAAGKKVAPMKKAVKKKLAKKRVTPKKSWRRRRQLRKGRRRKQRSAAKGQPAGKQGAYSRSRFGGKAEASIRRHSRWRDRECGRESNLEICRIVQRPRRGFGECRRIARAGKRVRGRGGEGVEDAEGSDEGEVRTHEVPQDDVPGEYRDKEE